MITVGRKIRDSSGKLLVIDGHATHNRPRAELNSGHTQCYNRTSRQGPVSHPQGVCFMSALLASSSLGY